MYAGTTIRGRSGDFIGVHQKIDRIARRNLNLIQPKALKKFPSSKLILHFEGNNGPDGIKRKSPSQDEPWHFIDPSNVSDHALVTMIHDHYDNLVLSLKKGDVVRSAFEAAWMAHAITDGLTPAHHYPLSDKIEELWGKSKDARVTVKDKNIIHGNTRRDTFVKNWQYWGAKGVFTTHVLFELGVATSIKTTRFPHSAPSITWLTEADRRGLDVVFMETVQEIYAMHMYERFWKQGWTTGLVRETRQILIPKICDVVVYAWYAAYKEAYNGKN